MKFKPGDGVEIIKDGRSYGGAPLKKGMKGIVIRGYHSNGSDGSFVNIVDYQFFDTVYNEWNENVGVFILDIMLAPCSVI